MMDGHASALEDEEWELCNDDGFVYKRKKRRLDPEALTRVPVGMDVDPEELKQRLRERKRKTLLKIKAKYQNEICQWNLLSSTLHAMEEKARELQHQRQREREQEVSEPKLPDSPSTQLQEADSANGSTVDDLLLQVEAQEAIIHDVSNLCDVVEAVCNEQEEQFKQSLLNLPIWASPEELMESLCDD